MSNALDELIELMRKLRDPEKGCPWDIKQDFKSIASCTLEEAYEVVEAIEHDDMPHLCEELGDLLLQIVFHSQMAEEKGLFTIDDVAHSETQKMIERHPHVFGDLQGVDSAHKVLENWEAGKNKKRAEQAESENRPHSVLDGVNTALPATSRALKLQKRAAQVGFDWAEPRQIIAKIREETGEIEAEIDKNADINAVKDELGDLFFVLVNLARKLKIDPEEALRSTNRKFERRFRYIETTLVATGSKIEKASLDEMEALWQQAKTLEKSEP